MKHFIQWLARVFGAEITIVKTETKTQTRYVLSVPDGVLEHDVTIVGDVTVTGNLRVEGSLSASGFISSSAADADVVSLKK